MQTVRCSACNKKLAEADYKRLAIKCPRCGHINDLKATEPLTRAKTAQKESQSDRPSVQAFR